MSNTTGNYDVYYTFSEAKEKDIMPIKKGTNEDLPLSKCCNSKTKRGLKISQDSHNIYCTRCNSKQN